MAQQQDGQHKASVPASSSAEEAALEVFFDGACPLCAREVAMVRRRDQEGRIVFTDIAAPDFDAAARGYTLEELMDQMQGIVRGAIRIEGVEVFRQMYSLVGFPRLAEFSRLWGVSHTLELGYRIWAKNRLRWTGRCAGGSCGVAPGGSRLAAD